MTDTKQLWGWTFVVLAMTMHNVVNAVSEEVKPTCDFKEDDVQFFDIKITPTMIPNDLTTYVCEKKLIPINLDRNFHAIGFLPLIDNTDIVHHMILFGCPELQKDNIHRCDNRDNECRNFLVQWSRGIAGPICNHPNAGNMFGLTTLKSLSLQVHWNNHNGTDGLQDGSGFRVFYTSKFRKYDMGNVQIGQNDLEIPPGQTQFPQSGSCSSDCTKTWLPHPIYLTRAHIHIHYTGSGGLMEILRNGSVVSTVLTDHSYDYNNPPAHTFDKPFEVLPGDEVRVTCLFNTKDGTRKRNRTLHWGEGSDGEMCYAFVTYYPLVQDFDQCIQFDNYDICTKNGFAALGECIFKGFVHVAVGMGKEIINQCGSLTRAQSREASLCSDACLSAIGEVTNHPCMQGRLKNEAERSYLPSVDNWQRVKQIIDESTKFCQ